MSRIISGSGVQLNTDASTALNPPIVFSIEGPYYMGGVSNEVLVERVPHNMTVYSAVLLQKLVGFSGALTLQVEVSRDDGQTWSALFGQPLNLSYLMGNYSTVQSNVLVAQRDLVAGDLLRLNALNVQPGGEGFSLYLYYVDVMPSSGDSLPASTKDYVDAQIEGVVAMIPTAADGGEVV